MPSSLKSKILESLEITTSAERGFLAQTIAEQQLPMDDVLEILEMEQPQSMRFSWMLGHICQFDPSYAQPFLRYCFPRRNELKITGFDRTIARLCMFCERALPPELEGEIVSQLFEWLADPKAAVATKHYSVSALGYACANYPELRPELEEVIADQIKICSRAFKHRAMRVLADLDKGKL